MAGFFDDFTLAFHLASGEENETRDCCLVSSNEGS